MPPVITNVLLRALGVSREEQVGEVVHRPPAGRRFNSIDSPVSHTSKADAMLQTETRSHITLQFWSRLQQSKMELVSYEAN